MNDPNTVRRIVRASGIGPDDIVVEIGPGLGSLTLALVETAQRVVVVEIEDAFAAQLPTTLEEFAPGSDVDVVHADALSVTDLPGPAPTALVANLPYNVSVPVLLHFFEHFDTIRTGLVMVQSEVADRLVAGPGSKIYGVPSVKAAWYGELKLAGAVGRNVFWPSPNVDSALVSWVRRETPGDETLRKAVFAVVDAAFGQRRKTLRAALAAHFGSPALAEEALRAAGVDPQQRGEQLTLDEFIAIASV